jgi:hypothetical protein
VNCLDDESEPKMFHQMFVKVRFDLTFLVTGVELEILGTVGIKFTINFDKINKSMNIKCILKMHIK